MTCSCNRVGCACTNPTCASGWVDADPADPSKGVVRCGVCHPAWAHPDVRRAEAEARADQQAEEKRRADLAAAKLDEERQAAMFGPPAARHPALGPAGE